MSTFNLSALVEAVAGFSETINPSAFASRLEKARATLGDSCLAKLREGEPIFVLRSQDLSAPGLVRAWAEQAQSHGTPQTKVAGARRIAEQMEDWQQRFRRFVKQPD